MGQVPDTDAGQVKGWAGELAALHARVAWRVGRPEPRRRALAYLQGLLGQVDRKNSWHLAEPAGERTPDGMQRLPNQAGWDADAVRDELRTYVVEQLGDSRAGLVVDETGFCKKGTKSVGVARQDTRGRPGGSRTARSGCSWPTPVQPGTRWSTESCTCPAAGPTTWPVALRQACPTRLPSAPSPSSPRPCLSAQ